MNLYRNNIIKKRLGGCLIVYYYVQEWGARLSFVQVNKQKPFKRPCICTPIISNLLPLLVRIDFVIILK